MQSLLASASAIVYMIPNKSTNINLLNENSTVYLLDYLLKKYVDFCRYVLVWVHL